LVFTHETESLTTVVRGVVWLQLVRNMRANMDFIRQKEEEQNNMIDSPRRVKDSGKRGSRIGSKPARVKCILS
jgi:hypothetical protein